MENSDPVSLFVRSSGPILALDIGSGTQDALLALPDTVPENWPQFVLPAPARQTATRIAELTAARKPFWLYGSNMGGGFAEAVARHVAAGLSAAASPEAAEALHDKPENVRAMGVEITPRPPRGHVPVPLTDFDPGFWNALFAMTGLPRPRMVAAAAQDHGVHADTGNREGRFRLWRELLTAADGDPARLVAPPSPVHTRLIALRKATGGPTADTGAAAALGALSVPDVRERSWSEGVLAINIGNSHTTAFLIWREKILGVYEHHTGLLTQESLLEDLQQFRLGWLPDEQVRAAGGHGCAFAENFSERAAGAEGFRPAYVLGPRRELLAGHGRFLAPHGSMMLAGCHGLLYGLAIQDVAI